ncbi:MAG: RecX family transcriptional regulator [Candidatus Doudnabacteria bacterium]|nr:RecX family transcriptional regulator [Candidatus Doudnabacteria bacterium]
MTITSLSQAARDRERVNVFVDGEFGFAIDKMTLAKHMLHQGMGLDEEKVSEILQEDNTQYLYRRILDFWFKKPRSRREVNTKIQELVKRRQERLDHKKPRFAANLNMEEIAVEIGARLQTQGFTDEKYADWFAAERARQGKYGKRKVILELQSKGINSRLAQEAVDRHFGSDAELAQKLLAKKYKVSNLKEIADLKLRSQAYRWLLSRGVRPT